MTFEDTIWLARGCDGVTRSPLEFPDDFADGEEVAEYKLVRKGVVRRKVTVSVVEIPATIEAAQ